MKLSSVFADSIRLGTLCAIAGMPLVMIAQDAAAEVLSVKAQNANFRENPHEAAKIKFTADQFYPVEVVERKKGWVKVKDFEGDTAWVADKVLGKQATVVITADRANIRENPNTSSDVLFKVERGEVFKIEERKGEWMKVADARGDGGWVRVDMTWGDPKKEGQPKVEPKAEPKDPKEKAKPIDADAKSKDAESSKANAKDGMLDIKLPKLSDLELAIARPDFLSELCERYVQISSIRDVKTSHALKDLCVNYLSDEQAEKKPEPKAEPKPEKKNDKKAPAKPKK